MKQKKQKDKYVVVISYDAFSIDNWVEAKQQPHLAQLIASGSSTNQVKSVYPTLTYVIHTSYVSGMYPNKHGVYHNNPLQPFVSSEQQEWFWFHESIKARTIFDAVSEAGLTSASLLWPASGKASINYNIPEVRAINNESQILKILKSGSPLYSIEMELKFGRIRKGIAQPFLDDFSTACAVDTIKRKRPNLLMVHLINLDDIKHERGTQGTHISDVIVQMDNRIGDIVQATKDAGTFDKTTFVIIGDHGQKDVHTKIHLNRLLMEHNLIWYEAGQLKWRAYVQGAGGSAYLYIKSDDDEAKKLVLEILNQALATNSYGLSTLFGREQLDALGVSDHISYMLEAKEGYCFEDDVDKPILDCLTDRGEVYATHGYLPTLPSYTSNLVISGDGVKQGAQFEKVEVVDLAPTIASLLDVPFGPCDGRVWHEVLVQCT